jgi:xanthine dehydrogenase YagS FAD-binding subunit
MRAFEYVSPKTREQAVGLLGQQWGDTEILAGGTDLLSRMKDDVAQPKRVVNIKEVAAMHAITRSGRGMSLGALATLDQVLEAAQVRQQYPMLAVAVSEAASPQIRNMATIGGNMCQRPRCWYFRNGFGLLGTDPKTGKSLIPEGDNRYHAILGNEGPAYFVSPSSIAPALIAYGATVRIAGPNGQREVALEKFFRIPKSENEREHDLQPNEMLTEIVIPAAPAGAKVAHYEVRQKAAFDWPLATAAVLLQMSGNTVQSARVVMGHVAPMPWVSNEAAQALQGKTINEATADAAGQAAVANAKSLGRNAYKIKLARVAVRRAILQAARGGRA